MLNYSLGLTATDWKNVESRSQHSAPYMVPEQSTGRENKSSTWPALSGNENTAPPHLLSTMVDKVMPVDLSVLKPNGSWDSGWAKKCQTEHWAANPRLCSGLWEVRCPSNNAADTDLGLVVVTTLAVSYTHPQAQKAPLAWFSVSQI